MVAGAFLPEPRSTLSGAWFLGEQLCGETGAGAGRLAGDLGSGLRDPGDTEEALAAPAEALLPPDLD